MFQPSPTKLLNPCLTLSSILAQMKSTGTPIWLRASLDQSRVFSPDRIKPVAILYTLPTKSYTRYVLPYCPCEIRNIALTHPWNCINYYKCFNKPVDIHNLPWLHTYRFANYQQGSNARPVAPKESILTTWTRPELKMGQGLTIHVSSTMGPDFSSMVLYKLLLIVATKWSTLDKQYLEGTDQPLLEGDMIFP